MKKKVIGQLIFALFIILYSGILIQPAFADNVSIATDWSWKAYSDAPSNWTELNYDDTFWMDVDAPHDHKVRPTSIKNMEDTRAQWIWSASRGGDDVFRYFRKAFWLTDKPTSAVLRITADDDYWLYVNGVFVGSDSHYFGNAPEWHWQTAEVYDITHLLKDGKNVIAVKVYEWGLYEGLLLDCTMEGTELSPINFWVAFPRWIGFLVFTIAVLSIILAILYVPRRVSKKTLVAIITSRGKVSFKTLSDEMGRNEKKVRKVVSEMISKGKLKAKISEDEKMVELIHNSSD
ncbi:MAG: PCI domain-containing protein [Candidatus Lokiarchaeota archaeon]|nr:PCI domain-containing protein [Candidatus Lokiarchaeota archaeon]